MAPPSERPNVAATATRSGRRKGFFRAADGESTSSRILALSVAVGGARCISMKPARGPMRSRGSSSVIGAISAVPIAATTPAPATAAETPARPALGAAMSSATRSARPGACTSTHVIIVATASSGTH